MKRYILILSLIVFSCSKEDPEPVGCVTAIHPTSGREKLACSTESQFNVAVQNGGKIGTGTNTLHPDWDYYSEHRWEICESCD